MNTTGSANPKDPGIYCRHCGYDLRASGEMKRCPECGWGFDPANPKTYAQRPPRLALRRWTQRIVGLLAILAVVLEATWGWLYWDWKGEQDALAKLGVQDFTSAPLGGPRGEKVQSYLGPASWVLDRVKRVDLPPTSDDAALVQVRKFKRLQWLDLDSPRVTDTGLGQIRGLTDLQYLSLSAPLVTDTGLGQIRGLTDLRDLTLSAPLVTDTALGQIKGLTDLRDLSLFAPRVTDAGLAHLKELRGLRWIGLFGTRVTKAGVEDFQAAKPGVYVNCVPPPPSAPAP